LRIAPSDFSGSVGRAIVDDDDLERPVALGKNALDRLRDVALPVVHGHQHADEGSHRLGVEIPSSPDGSADDVQEFPLSGPGLVAEIGIVYSLVEQYLGNHTHRNTRRFDPEEPFDIIVQGNPGVKAPDLVEETLTGEERAGEIADRIMGE